MYPRFKMFQTNRYQTFLALLLCMVASGAAMGQSNKRLKIGDTAPGFDVERWIGTGSEGLVQGATNVVCFIDPGSDPKETIGDLERRVTSMRQRTLWSEIHFVCIMTGDTDADVIASAVTKLRVDGEKLAIGIDRRNGSKRKWIDSPKLKVPWAFIVDGTGKIQHWSPFLLNARTKDAVEEFASILERTSQGRYNAKLIKRAQPALRQLKTSRRTKNWRQFDKLVDELIEQNAMVFSEQHLQRFETKLLDRDTKDIAYAYARQVAQDNPENLWLIAEMARKIATDPKIPDDKRDLDIALELAITAAKLVDPKSPRRYSIPAEIHFRRGELAEAINMQKQAYRSAAPGFLKDRMKFDLDNYNEARRQARRANRVP